MNRKNIVLVALVVVAIFGFFEPAFAGPGGKIASAAFETFWGRIILLVLTIVFLPVIAYVLMREKISERRARKDLRFMAAYSSKFEWLKIQERAKDCFFRVHSGWEDGDLSQTVNWMTDWYWQNQQMCYRHPPNTFPSIKWGAALMGGIVQQTFICHATHGS